MGQVRYREARHYFNDDRRYVPMLLFSLMQKCYDNDSQCTIYTYLL